MAWVRPTKKQRRQHQPPPVEFHQTDTFHNALQYFSCKPMPSSTPMIDHAKALRHHGKPQQKLLEAPPSPVPAPPPAPRHHRRSKTAGPPPAKHHRQSEDHDIVLVEEEDDGEAYLEEVRRAVRQEMQQQFSSARDTGGSSRLSAPRPSPSRVQYESAVLRPKPSFGPGSFVRDRHSYSHLGTAGLGMPKTASSRWAGATSALPGLC